MPSPLGTEPTPASLDRRAELLDAAVRTIRRDGADASMNDIAAEAGITKPVLYQHFASKAGLAAALADRFLVDVGARLGPLLAGDLPPHEAIPAGIGVFVRFATAEPSVFRFLTEGAAGAGREAPELPMVTALASMLADYLLLVGATGDDRRARTWAMAVMGMVITTVAWWADEGGGDRDALIDDLTALVLRGLAAPESGSD